MLSKSHDKRLTPSVGLYSWFQGHFERDSIPRGTTRCSTGTGTPKADTWTMMDMAIVRSMESCMAMAGYDNFGRKLLMLRARVMWYGRRARVRPESRCPLQQCLIDENSPAPSSGDVLYSGHLSRGSSLIPAICSAKPTISDSSQFSEVTCRRCTKGPIVEA